MSNFMKLDLDVSIIKGLLLLHSTENDSEEQLQQLWRQSVSDKFGTERTPVSLLNKISLPSGPIVVHDDYLSNTKKLKAGDSSFFQKSSSVSPKNSSSDLLSNLGDDVEMLSNDEGSEENDASLEILNNDGICVKCRSSTSNSSNKLIECVDCHTHYHMQCHFPPITDMDVSDPRFVWYCSACESNITTTTNNDKKNVNISGSLNVNKSATTKGNSNYGRISSVNNKLSNESRHFSNSSSTHEKKTHLMKNRSQKKHDKKKSNK